MLDTSQFTETDMDETQHYQLYNQDLVPAHHLYYDTETDAYEDATSWLTCDDTVIDKAPPPLLNNKYSVETSSINVMHNGSAVKFSSVGDSNSCVEVCGRDYDRFMVKRSGIYTIVVVINPTSLNDRSELRIAVTEHEGISTSTHSLSSIVRVGKQHCMIVLPLSDQSMFRIVQATPTSVVIDHARVEVERIA
jgi:hypothetical protein